MGVRFTDTEVRIDGLLWMSGPASTDAVYPLVWSPAVIRWGYTDTMAEPEPSTLQLRVTIPIDNVLNPSYKVPAYGQTVSVSMRVNHYTDPDEPGLSTPPKPVFYGFIDGATRRRRYMPREGSADTLECWEIDLTASGSFAKLARTMLADEPWPLETAPQRMQRILALLPDPSITESGTTYTGTTYYVRGRDVDNFSSFEALRRTLRNVVPYEYPDRYGVMFHGHDLVNVFALDGAGMVEVTQTGTLLPLSAAKIVDTDRLLDVGSVINSVSVEAWVPANDDPYDANPDEYTQRSIVRKSEDSIDTYGEAQWRLESDKAYGLFGRPPNEDLILDEDLTGNLGRILDRRATERWTTDGPLELHLPSMGITDSNVLYYACLPAADPVDIDRRFLQLTEAPPDLEPVQRVIGGELVIHGDHTQQRAYIYTEPPDATLATTSILIKDAPTDVPISAYANVTWQDARTVSDFET